MKRNKITRNFNLRKGTKTPKGKLSIRLMIRINGSRSSYYVGYTVEERYWDYKKQRVKNNVGLIDEVVINRVLDETERAFDEAKNHILYEGLPLTGETIKELMDEKLGKKVVVKNDLWGFVESFIETSIGRVHKGVVIKDETIRKYRNYRNILQRFERSDNKKMRFDNVNHDWFGRFNKWAVKEGYGVNTIDRIVGVLKVWLNSAVKKKITTCEDYKEIRTDRVVTKKIYLTETELLKIHTAELSCESLENVRCLFLLGCYTGLRYSDIYVMERKHIYQDESGKWKISLHQTKTGDPVTIPLHPILRGILEERNWELLS